MKEGWVGKKLGDTDLLKIIDGDRGKNYPKQSEFLGEGYCLFLNTKNVRPDGFNFDTTMFFDKEKDKALRKGKLNRRDVVLTTRGTIGNVAIYDDSVEFDHIRINSGMLVLRPNERIIISEYLFRILLSPVVRTQIVKHTSGAAQPQLPIKTLVNFTIPVPALPEQRRIVSIVDQAFEGIDRAIAHTKKNLTNARELFESYLNAIFSQKGDGWSEKRLSDLSEVQSGGTPSRAKSEYWGGEIAWYSSGELNDLYTATPQRNITEKGLENSNAKLFSEGSLLIGMYDTAALKMSILDRKAAFNQAIAGVKPNEKLDLVFILHAINFVKPEILSLRRGVRQKNLSLQKIKDIALAVPELQEQQRVVRQLASMREETQRLETIYRQKLAALNELKQSILQKAFTGELTADIANQTTKKAEEAIAA